MLHLGDDKMQNITIAVNKFCKVYLYVRRSGYAVRKYRVYTDVAVKTTRGVVNNIYDDILNQ